MAVRRNIRPRDGQGWRVPRAGTIAADIYALAKKGLSAGEIANALGRGRNNVRVHLFKIKRPERGNQLGNARRKPRERKTITSRGSPRPQGSEHFASATGRGSRVSPGRALERGRHLGDLCRWTSLAPCYSGEPGRSSDMSEQRSSEWLSIETMRPPPETEVWLYAKIDGDEITKKGRISKTNPGEPTVYRWDNARGPPTHWKPILDTR